MRRGTRAGARAPRQVVRARGPLARKGAPSRHKTGAYGVDVAAFERVALPLLAAHAGRRRLIVIDEIGRMEMHSAKFAEAVQALLDDADALAKRCAGEALRWRSASLGWRCVPLPAVAGDRCRAHVVVAVE